MDLEMKIQPSFVDHECAIVFSFYFSKNTKKIGEAVVLTYGEAPCDEIASNGIATYQHPAGQKNKIAYLKEFSICEEHIKESLHKIHHFLNIIGIHKLGTKLGTRYRSWTVMGDCTFRVDSEDETKSI